MPNSLFKRGLDACRKIGIQTIVVAVLEAIYVLVRYRLPDWPSFARQYSNSLFLLSLLLLTLSVVYSFGFFGWRRRQQLPSLFPARTSRQDDEETNHPPGKKELSFTITSVLLMLLAVLLSPHSN